ncbi:MAG: TIGR03663 family protein [Anaerolineales bacterium]|nr:TIGR03663 family protein [Anaerolineales bacterium]
MATATLPERSSTLDRPLWSVITLDWEKALYLVLILAAFATRFYDLGARVMSHDESLHTQYSWYLYKNGNYVHTPMMHGPLKFHLTAFTYWLFGDNDFTSRIPTALLGVAAVAICYYYRRWLGRTGALVAAFLMLISPYQLYYSRYIRDEPYVMVWGLLTVLLVLNYLERREAKFLYALTLVGTLFYATMESSFIYVAIVLVFVGLFLVYDLVVTAWPRPELRQPFLICLGIAAVAAVIGVAFFFYRDRLGIAPPSSGEVQSPAVPGRTTPEGGPISSFETYADLAWLGAALVAAAGLAFVARAFGREGLKRFPALDVIAVMGVFVLPQVASFVVRGLGRNPLNYTLPAMTGFDLGLFLGSDAGTTLIVTILLIGLSVAIGLFWNPRVFLICAAIFYGVYIPLFTTFFTNGGGLATGLIGSLGYWMEQHGVRRGSQPWYYYLVINLPMYEFLPLLGALFAAGLGLRRLWQGPALPPAAEAGPAADGEAAESVSAPPRPFPVLAFIGYWAVMALGAFSVAGEKMPWLTTHIVLPMILLSGWAFGRLIDGTDWSHFRARRAWVVAVLLPVTVLAVAAVFGGLLGTQRPFQGSELPQLQATSAFVSALIVAGIGLFALYRLAAPLGWGNVARLTGLAAFGGLALLTARTAFIATYLNYDYANEFLVYAHGSRGVRTVMSQVEDISQRTTDGLGLKVAYDSEVSWPMTWYFRNFKNQAFYGSQPTREALDAPVVIAGAANWSKVETLLGDRFYQFEYIRMVWPMQDYFPKTDQTIAQRIVTALGDPQMRQALFNIWWNRDYTLYGQLTNQDFDLAKWPLVDRMRLYVRKDIAGQIWSYGVGPAEVVTAPQTDPYSALRQTLAANLVTGALGPAEGQFDGPRGVAVGPDGSVYVADSRNNRIEKYDAAGQFVRAWGRLGQVDAGTGSEGGTFNEPWGLTVGPDGAVYVADLWNHRIQKFDADGRFIRMWGRFDQDGAFDSFYGPRAIVADAQGHLYVADTGNDRVVVFDSNGTGLSTIGSSGFELGQLDEPVGLAVSADGGELYVADTWNQRIQRFRKDSASGEYVADLEWTLSAWYGQSLDNKPYLALDSRGRVYATDPEGYRVLVFDRDGQFVTTWGDAGADNTTFSLLTGVAVDAEGQTWVVDYGNNRLMRFPAIP